MELTLDQKDILVSSILRNATVSGKFGANAYNVCELMNLHSSSLVALGNSVKAALNSVKDSIKPSRTLLTRLSADLELVLLVISIKDAQEAEFLAAQSHKKNAVEKLAALMNRKAKDDMAKIKRLNAEEVEAEIQKYTDIINS